MSIPLDPSSPPPGSSGQAANVAALTDNSGGAATDGTIGAVTAPTAIGATLTDDTGGSGTHDDTLADGETVGAALTDSTGGTPGDTLAAIAAAGTYADDDAAIRDALASLATKVNELRTDSLTHNQNISDLGQKVIELVTAQGQDRTAIVALTDAVAELAAKVNAEIAALKAASLQASA